MRLATSKKQPNELHPNRGQGKPKASRVPKPRKPLSRGKTTTPAPDALVGESRTSGERLSLRLYVLERRADDLARADCHARLECEMKGKDGHVCSGTGFHWAYIVGRDEKVIRHDPANCLLICEGGHDFYTKEPDAFTDLVNKHWPGRLAALFKARRLLSGGGLASKERCLAWIAFFKGGPKPEFAVKWRAAHPLGEEAR